MSAPDSRASSMEPAKHTHTIVVEFTDMGTPNYYAGMQVLGGRVVAVDFGGDRLRVAEDLLEALEGLMALERRGRVMPIGREWDAARAAIAKATGGSA